MSSDLRISPRDRLVLNAIIEIYGRVVAVAIVTDLGGGHGPPHGIGGLADGVRAEVDGGIHGRRHPSGTRIVLTILHYPGGFFSGRNRAWRAMARVVLPGV